MLISEKGLSDDRDINIIIPTKILRYSKATSEHCVIKHQTAIFHCRNIVSMIWLKKQNVIWLPYHEGTQQPLKCCVALTQSQMLLKIQHSARVGQHLQLLV